MIDPGQKRGASGGKFVRNLEREALALGNVAFQAQGTIYADVIESAGKGGGEARVIKTHHNVGGLPADMQFRLVEPLRMLFKDEVRRLGAALGLPDAIVWRQPFPGPGLAVRCLGEVNWERLERLRAADVLFLEELAAADLLREGTQQAFALLRPGRSVRGMGDGRACPDGCALRAVRNEGLSTADCARQPHAPQAWGHRQSSSTR